MMPNEWVRAWLRWWRRCWAAHTFEGTETMQTLIVGRDITGIGAFT